MAGGLNLYAYVGNNPASYTDPFGLCKKGFEAVCNKFSGAKADPCANGPGESCANAFFQEMAKRAPAIKEGIERFIPENVASAAGAVALGEAGAAITSLTRSGSPLGRVLGRANPVKLNSAGQMQPYAAASGRYLSPSANPGVGGSAAYQFVVGIGQGYAEGMNGGVVAAPTPVTQAQEWGQMVGRVAQAIVDRIFR